MGTNDITANFTDAQVKGLNALVDGQRFKTKSEAIRFAVQTMLDADWAKEIIKKIKKK